MGCLLHTPLFVAGTAVLALSFGLYFALQLLCGTFYKTQNLKRRYPGASWALVTGSSSGERGWLMAAKMAGARCCSSPSAGGALDRYAAASEHHPLARPHPTRPPPPPPHTQASASRSRASSPARGSTCFSSRCRTRRSTPRTPSSRPSSPTCRSARSVCARVRVSRARRSTDAGRRLMMIDQPLLAPTDRPLPRAHHTPHAHTRKPRSAPTSARTAAT